MQFSHKTFFDKYKAEFDSTLDKSQVDGLEFLLSKFESDSRWKDLRHIAYALATVYHECAGSWQPVEEGYYLGSKTRVKAFQKTLRYYPYFGRGFVQLTWETKKIPNYSKASKALGVDFVKNPNLVLEPEHSYEILTRGMFEGWFTGKKLSHYINDKICDYTNARKIINGLDKASLIARYAKDFESILRASKVSAAASINAETPSDPLNEQSPNQTTGVNTPTGTPVESPKTEPPIEVPQVKPEEEKPQDFISKFSAKLLAIPAAVLAYLSSVGAWATSAPLNLVLALLGVAAVITVVYLALYLYLKNRREAREHELKREREQRAFELQKMTLESAMRPDLNTVTILPQPIKNSDSNEVKE